MGKMEKDKAVQNWFESVGLHKTRTLRNYKREFPIFLEWLQSKYPQFKTPSDIIKDKEKSKKHKWESIIVKFKNYLESERRTPKGERLASATIHGYVRCVQSFFSHNDEKLQFRRGELKIEPSEKEKVFRKWIPTNPEIRAIYRHAKTPRTRSLILVLYQSGFAPIDVSQMNIEDFPFYNEKGEWNLRPETHLYHCRRREKTNVWQETCISYEALEDIRMMLELRGYPKEGALFIGFTKKRQRLSPREINNAIKRTVAKAFKNRLSEWKTKHLRDSYKNGLVQAKLSQEVIDCLFGHERKGARKNYQLTEATTKMMYSEAWKYLRINGFSSTTKLQKLEKDIEALKSYIQKREKDTEFIIEKQQDTIKNMQDMIRELAEKLGKLNRG